MCKISKVNMCSLTSPSSAGVQDRLLGSVEGECSLPNTNFSSLDINSDVDWKIMQLELKKSRLEAQINLSKTQTMLAEMELHLVEIEIRHELWRRKSEPHVHPPATCQTRRPYRRLLIRKQIRPTVRFRYRKPKSYTQDKRHETTDDGNVEENIQLPDGSHPVDLLNHHKQVGEFGETRQEGEVLTNDQRSLNVDGSEVDRQNRGEKQHNSRFNPDQCHLEVTRGESPPTVVQENVENMIDPQDALLVADSSDGTDADRSENTSEINKANMETEIVKTDDIIGKEEDKHQYASRKEQKSKDSKTKTIKKVKRRTKDSKSSNASYNKDQEAEINNNDMHETNTEAFSTKSQKKTSSEDGHISKKHTAVNKNTDIQNNDMKTCSITMVRIPNRVRSLNDSISLEINNNDVNRKNSEKDDAVDATLNATIEANRMNAIVGIEAGVVGNIALIVQSKCENAVHEENTLKKNSNEKKKSENNNVEDKKNYVSKERHRSRDSKTKSSNKDKKYESKRRTTSSSNNVEKDKEAEKNKNNDRRKSNADKSHDKSRKSKKTGSHRNQKDEYGTNKDKDKHKENQSKIGFDQGKIDNCNKIKSKSSIVVRTTIMQSASDSERAKNVDAVGNKETENIDNYFLGRETDAFDSKSSILDKTTQELQDIGNNLLFKELRNCTIKKERSPSLSSMETLKLYE